MGIDHFITVFPFGNYLFVLKFFKFEENNFPELSNCHWFVSKVKGEWSE